jgi:hypothetical protein
MVDFRGRVGNTTYSLSTTLITPFFHIILENIIAIGSIASIRKPTAPASEPPPIKRTAIAIIETITRTGITPTIPFLTTFFPEDVLLNNPSVSEPNSAGII